MKFVSLLLIPIAAGLLQGAPYFEPNRGQSQTSARFIGRSARGLAAVESSSLRLRTASGAAIDVTLDSANPNAEGAGVDPLPGVSHYAVSRDPASWIFGVPHFSAVEFQNVYRNVSLRFHYSGDDLEFDFNVARSSAIPRIRLHFREDISLSPEGDLLLAEGRVQRPVAWQIVAGKRRPVEVAFRQSGRRVAGFRLGPHDPSQPVIIDPTIDFGTFLGGSGAELDTQLAVDNAGNIYMAGTTQSIDFPAAELPGSPLNVPISLRDADVYLTRLKPDASTIDWSFFIGGTARERCAGLALDSIGDVYLYGATVSANFPVTPNAWKTTIDSSLTDTFVTKFNAQTGMLLASSYTGFTLNTGMPNANANGAFAVDSAGGVYLAGSPGASFQATSGAYSKTAGTGGVVRLNSGLTNPVYATYLPLGTPGLLAADAAGNLIITGLTAFGSQAQFPAINPIPGINSTFQTGFIAKLNAAGSSLIYASLLSGPALDLQVDVSGNAWVAGLAISDTPLVHSLVPAPVPAPQPGILSALAFFAEIPPQAGSFLQSTVFDGPDYQTNNNSVNPQFMKLIFPPGRTCLLGVPVATQTAGAFANATGNALACSDLAGSAVEIRTKLPGAFYGAARATPDGAILLAGTGSRNFPSTPGVVQPAFAGGTFTNDPFTLYGDDAILLRVSLPNPVPVISSVTPDSILVNSYGSVPYVGGFTLLGSGFSYGEQITLNGNPLAVSSIDSPDKITLSSIPLTALQPGANQIVATTSGPGGGVSNSAVVTAYNPTPASVAISPATVTVGSPETKMIVSGNGIIASSVLTWNGQVRSTTFVPSTNKGAVTGSLQFLVEPSELTEPSVVTVAVSNPAPGGGTSPSARFVVQDSAGAAVPSLSTATIFVPLSDSSTPDPTVTVTGKGFNLSTTATWDGSAIPAYYVSATQLKITAPPGVLSTLGTYQIQVANGGLTSNVVPLTVERATGQSSFAYDPARQILYLLVSPTSPNQTDVPYDLQMIDARTGKRTGGVSGLISRPAAIAVSADGNYVYVAGGDTGLEIRRFNTSSASVDLDFQVQQAPAAVQAQIVALAVVAGAPETVAVAMTTVFQGGFTLSIYDRDKPRPLSMPVLSGSTVPLLFATADKIFVGYESLTSCFAWMNFDSSGLESSTECGENPPEMRSSHGFVWLTDGVRNATVAAAYGAGNAIQPTLSWQVDPANSAAWAMSTFTPVQLYRMDLNTMQQTTTPIPYAGSFANLLLAGDGTVRMLSSGSLTAPPSNVAPAPAGRSTAIRSRESRPIPRGQAIRR